MTRLSVNLSTLFTEVPLAHRFAPAASCGFTSVEVQYPYALPAAALKRALDEYEQTLVLINGSLGREPKRRGLAGVAGRRDAFRTTLLEAIEYATATGCELIHVLSGVIDPHEFDVSQATWLGNMAWAAQEAGDAGVTLVVEALNRTDAPGYFLRSIDHAVSLIDQIGSPHLKLLFDAYHCAMDGGDCVSEIRRRIDHVRHVQIADCPGRGAPGTGDIDWTAFFEQLGRLPYSGAIGLEFINQQGAAQCADVLCGLLHQPWLDAVQA
ncbi:hydroxypyruvate isomerase family protein [Pandoraea sp. NPDC087047]|uniref:hydroxypyruvate isomerase family protein n=1 Tax=Pandoraea sp. NPDC087047 TaxID=3364390 RepID=UPI0037FFD8B2